MTNATRRGLALGVSMFVFGIAIVYVASGLPGSIHEPLGSGTLPMGVGYILAVLGVAVFAQDWRARLAPPAKPLHYRQRFDLGWAMIALSAGYVALMQSGLAGFRIATAVYLLALPTVLFGGARNRWLATAVLAVVIGVTLHFLFTKVLYVDLPQ